MAPAVDQYDIAIVGCGIGGVCLAVGLLKSGFKVTIYESISAISQATGGITLAPNARRALRLIGPDLGDAVGRAMTNNLTPDDQDLFFNYRVGCAKPGGKHQNDDVILAHRCAEGQSTGARSDILTQMYTLVPDNITHFGKRLVHIEDLGSERGIRLVFRDGSEAVHGTVIGCDGIRSTVRKHILGWDHPASNASYSGKFIHRGIIPMEIAEKEFGKDRCANSNIYLGPGGHLLHFPVNRGMGVVVAVYHASQEWTYDQWTITTEELANQKQQVDFNDKYKNWSPTVRSLYSNMKASNLWALFDTYDHPAPTFYKGRCVMIGDAAHASTPALGAGSGMAMEDAYIMVELFKYAREIGADVATANRAFDQVRRPRTQLCVEASREAGKTWALQHGGCGDDLDKVASEIPDRYNWVWDWNDKQELLYGKRFISADTL
ncbi:MAG: hypothetical protein Q9159_003830 [Coniocarpon cinnabarinum]